MASELPAPFAAYRFPEATPLRTRFSSDRSATRRFGRAPMRRFVIHADRRLQRPESIDALKGAFGLAGHEVPIGSDTHYR